MPSGANAFIKDLAFALMVVANQRSHKDLGNDERRILMKEENQLIKKLSEKKEKKKKI